MPKSGRLFEAIGDRGEALFHVAITKRNGRDYPLFKVVHLGQKFKGLDFYVELTKNNSKIRPFFFVQVKSTNNKVSATKKLAITVEKKSVTYIQKYPAPVFVIGVQEDKGKVYIAGLANKAKGISSIGTKFEVRTAAVQERLYQDVLKFWKAAVFNNKVTCFR